ncbi:secondary thiamine-phosphate synthase enzyme YjbQ [Sulfuriroseicoccus oceanibius]|uniref:YjbQ family protein n=1 Tax=Sulfuriroseicoccus oceanibius TaxID=2707525 RepID=A0A6B3LF62_9BACT|nr:secondary thiamine-phosphate synthase enzyme YjbQ [Sulfuriroseicoccus oceanibius]QQL45155.1 YjbQ family protein [Sulfuriroseicoccus oceanibius]
MISESKRIRVTTSGKGTYEVTNALETMVRESGVQSGTLTVFVRHTSASLIVMENADPSARRDLEEYFDRLVPENEPYFTHIYEGADDMPSHIRMALTSVSQVIPIVDGRLALGTWQGVFLFEHRRAPHQRELALNVMGL